MKRTVQVNVQQVTNFAVMPVSHHTVQCLPAETLLCSLCQYLKQGIKVITQIYSCLSSCQQTYAQN